MHNEKQKYKLRCRENRILVTAEPDKYDIVWCRKLIIKERYKIDEDYKRR